MNEQIRGIIKSSDFSDDKKVGDTISAYVLHESRNYLLPLVVIRLQQRSSLNQYQAEDAPKSSSLGDLIKEKLSDDKTD